MRDRAFVKLLARLTNDERLAAARIEHLETDLRRVETALSRLTSAFGDGGEPDP